MPQFNQSDLYDAMKRRHNIRNMCICAHVDSGKTTVSDSLLSKAQIISAKDTGNKRGMDTREDEQERCITIKSTGISLFYEMPEERLPLKSEGNGFLINLIDTPGHVDFSSEVTAAMRVTDGAIIIIDAVKGVSVQTKTVVKQSLGEMVRPVCMINKLDRLINELQLPAEEIYKKLHAHILELNSVIETHNQKMEPIVLDPRDGTVAIGCGLYGWGFNLPMMARKWCAKLDLTEEELIQKLWGDNFYHPKKKEWFTHKVKGSQRGFNLFVIKPIVKFMSILNSGDREQIKQALENASISIPFDTLDADPKTFARLAMQKFLPNADALLEMIVLHLPSPIEAQAYRVDHLYTGPKGDPYYEAIKNCDPDGPLVMYVSKMFPTADYSRFFAFGRVFSGTIKATDVHIQDPAYIPGEPGNSTTGKIQNVSCWMGAEEWTMPDCPAGNTIALSGIDKYLLKSGTLTSTSTKDVYNIKDMEFAVAPVVSVAVSCKNAADRPKFQQALAKLSKSDPLCVIHTDESGQTVISGAGELHLEICVKDLTDMLNPKKSSKVIEIMVSDPVVPFRETVISTNEESPCLAKSANKHNRLWSVASRMNPELADDIDNDKFNLNIDKKERSRLLVTEYGWSKDVANKIWDFDQINLSNVITDASRGVQYLNESRDMIVSSFGTVSANGPLCGEPLRGVHFEVNDGQFHSDNVHRSNAQILPMAKKSFCASFLSSQPRLMEPIYLCEIECTEEVAGSIYGIVARRRGVVIGSTADYKSRTTTYQVHLPVAESIGFTAFLRGETGGQAFPQCTFSHWDIVDSDPLDPNTVAGRIVKDVRSRKNMPETVFDASHYEDKL
jgi:elongation factor 2